MINSVNAFEYLRELAHSDYYQTLFVASKEHNGFRLFKNDFDFSQIQVAFFNWLYFYYNLQSDISSGLVSELVNKNSIFADAYSYYKYKSKGKQKKEKDNKIKNNELKIVFGKKGCPVDRGK
jgi:hypothetical protein